MEKMKAHVGKMEAQLNHWGTKIDALAAKTEVAGADVKADYRKRIEDLKTKHRAVQSKLDELRAAGADKWETFKAGMERSWKVFEKAFKKLTIRLKAELII